MGETPAFVFVDVGIAKTIGNAPTNLVKTRLKYKSPASNGLPTDEEFEAARSIEDALEQFAAETSSAYVGRVTVDGHRHFFVYSWPAAARWQPFVNALAASTGYELDVSFREDLKHEGYGTTFIRPRTIGASSTISRCSISCASAATTAMPNARSITGSTSTTTRRPRRSCPPPKPPASRTTRSTRIARRTARIACG